MDPSTMLGPIDFLKPIIEYLVLILVVANMATRHREHQYLLDQVKDDVEELTRYRPHVASNVALILATFYFLSTDYHGGVVLSILVIGMFISDFFEFEARQVQVRNDRDLEVPKASIIASGVVFLYAFYLSLFFVIEPAWRLIF